jgi:hypothetical protein
MKRKTRQQDKLEEEEKFKVGEAETPKIPEAFKAVRHFRGNYHC